MFRCEGATSVATVPSPLWWERVSVRRRSVLLVLLVMAAAGPADSWGVSESGPFHLGRVATPEEIQAWDIDVAPDGEGLPAGRGTVKEGAGVYAERCASCHGATGVEGPNPKLVGGQGTLASERPVKTVGSYWPYATTLFDYINRAMPFVAPQSLTSDQVYAVTAWILFRNGLLEKDGALDRKTLPKVRMPHRHGFVPDPRPDVTPVDSRDTTASSLGEIDFPTSGSPEAQQPFLRGVLLLHNFEYDDAQKAFRWAQELDPGFAMAYWGEAMTMTHPLWGEQAVQQALNVLRRLAPTPTKRVAAAPTKREQGYLRAVEALYEEGDKKQRDQAYMAAMQTLTRQFPEDDNAQAFYALSILGSAQGKRDEKLYLEAASIVQAVFERSPRHPGAVHYLIHALDEPAHAHGALEAARVYAGLAPAAPHARHMPSHIFMALGLWDDVIQANERSWAAGEQRRIRQGLSVTERSYHVAHWLMYALLQQGRVEEAKPFLRMVEEDAERVKSRAVQRYRAAMRATYIIETGEWDVTGLDRDLSSVRVAAAMSELFAIGLSAFKTGHGEVADRVLEQFRRHTDRAEKTPSHGRSVTAMKNQLSAMKWLAEGNVDEGLALLRETASLEDAMPFSAGPVFPVKPTHELFGEVLLSLGQRDEARRQFTLALERAPNRRLSLAGLTRASAP